MGGSDGNSRDRSNGAVASDQPFAALTKNPWAVIVIALIGGGTSGNFFGRPDPFTGDDAKAMKAEILAQLERDEERLLELERGQALDDEHRKQAAGGYFRIRSCEQGLAELKERCKGNKEDIEELQRRMGRDYPGE